LAPSYISALKSPPRDMVEAEAAGMAEGALEDLVVPASAAVTLAACVPVTPAECV
jgi:hypothetical protein